MTDPTDGGTVRYHRADWVPERDRWVVTFPGGKVQGFTAEQGEVMGLTPQEPALTRSKAFNVVLDELIVVDPHDDLTRENVAECIVGMLEVAGLLREARQDPQPTADSPSDDIDFDALPIGTVAEVTLLDGDRLLALKMDAVSGRNWFIGDCSDVDITKLCDVRIVHQPAPLSPGECLRGLLAG